MKKLLLMFWVLLGTALYAVEITDAQHAVDVAGKQRMLTQRMMADYVMIGLHSNFKNPQQNLTNTVEEFEENLHAIAQYSRSKSIVQVLEKVKTQWKPVKKILTSKVDKKFCEELSDKLDQVLASSNQVVIAIRKDTSTGHGEIIDISGRQRMLSQRIAGMYLMDLWFQNDASKKKLEDAMHLYESSLIKLKAFEKNTKEISKYLAKAEKSYLYIKNMRSTGLSMNRMPSLVYKKADDVFTSMNKVTHLYAGMMLEVALR